MDIIAKISEIIVIECANFCLLITNKGSVYDLVGLCYKSVEHVGRVNWPLNLVEGCDSGARLKSSADVLE